MRAYCAPFAPGGARLVEIKGGVSLQIGEKGTGRVGVIVKDAAVRQVDGHQPKIWKASQAAKECGVMIVASPGFQFETKGLNARPWRRWELQLDGSIVEVPRSVETI